jgi:acetolactate synthase-1/3 small subunit
VSDQKHILSVYVEDSPGELARIVGLFSGRGFNIDSLDVNRTENPGMSKVMIVTRGDDKVIEQITKQLNKLVRVYKVKHHRGHANLERELCLLRVNCQSAKQREELERIVALTSAKIVGYTATTFTLEVTGTGLDIDSFLELVRPLGIKEMVRSATIALMGVQTKDEGQENAA